MQEDSVNLAEYACVLVRLNVSDQLEQREGGKTSEKQIEDIGNHRPSEEGVVHPYLKFGLE